MQPVNNTRFQYPYRLLFTASIFGLIADSLLRSKPWGLNLFLTITIAIAAALVMSRWTGFTLSGEGRWLAPAMLFFSAGLMWRDSPTLNTANTAALLTATTLAVLTSRVGQLRRAGITQYGLGIVYVTLFAIAGLFPTLHKEVEWRRLGTLRGQSTVLSAGRGLVLAVPPLALFASLLAAADANFEHLVTNLVTIDTGDLVTRIVLISVYAWLLGGMLRELFLAPDRERIWGARNPQSRFALGSIEIGVILGLLDLLFATFVVLQVPYLFGGRAQISTLGYSEYARRGFFELVWVTGLALPLLLLLHWLVRPDQPRSKTVFRALAAIMVGLLFAIMASAVQRMQIYVADAGVTELRVQASAAMAWMAVVLVWFAWTVLRHDQRQRFAFGALLSAFVLVGALDAANPDDIIVRTNTQYGHLLNNGAFDERPLASLSPDAVPAIVDALPSLPEPQRSQAINRLRKRYPEPTQTDWRSFSWSRGQAEAALSQLP